jgi:Protein of Unknown function (DUF2784)
MGHALLADAVLLLHAAFIVWAVAGALALRWRPWLALAHLPAAAWAVWISWSGGYCPLTPLEQSLRRAAGQAGYEGGFVEHYLTRLIYPAGLTPDLQWLFGGAVLAINLALYALAAHRVISRRQQETRR